jgi:uncharacterized protein YqhQ
VEILSTVHFAEQWRWESDEEEEEEEEEEEGEGEGEGEGEEQATLALHCSLLIFPLFLLFFLPSFLRPLFTVL